MPDKIPPPGPERDEAIAIALGGVMVDLPDPIDGGTIRRMRLPGGALATELPPYSTDPAACDRLEAELDRRGYEVQVRRIAGYTNVFVRRGDGEPVAAIADSRPDAVSAAALLALRGGR